MNNKMIGRCENCDQDYCQECSENGNWQKFCSDKCEREHAADQQEQAKVAVKPTRRIGALVAVAEKGRRG